MSHDGENLETSNSVVSSQISTYVLSRQTNVFTIPELVVRIRYMLKWILKRLSVAKNRNAPHEIITKNSLKSILYYAFGRFRPVASVVSQAELYYLNSHSIH